MKYDHPNLIKKKIHDLYSDLIQDRKEVVFVWVPDHVDISGNSAADSAAKGDPDHPLLMQIQDYVT